MLKNITFSIHGKNVSPATVSVTDLVEMLGALHAALNVTAGGTANLSLMEIRDTSDTLILGVNQQAEAAASMVIDAVTSGDDSQLKPAASANVRKIWTKIKNREWDYVSLSVPSRNGSPEKIARITSSQELFVVPRTTGQTTLMVYVTRIGGVPRPTVKFNLPGVKGFTADIKTTQLAEQIPLYKHVELHGEATWDSRTWKLEKFVVDKIGSYHHSDADPVGSLDRLSQLSDGTWDTIDPTEFFNDLRSN